MVGPERIRFSKGVALQALPLTNLARIQNLSPLVNRKSELVNPDALDPNTRPDPPRSSGGFRVEGAIVKLGARIRTVYFPSMKKAAASPKTVKKIDWDAVCERNRQKCNKLTDEERRHLRAKALQLIYSSDAETPARSR